MTILRLLLWPFSLLYAGIMMLRNQLYDRGVLKSTRFPIPVVSVGNLTVGGTGKTPHVEYLLRLLKHERTAVLSRGYKRKSKGFVLADERASAALLGDEPFQYHCDFPEVTVAVSESRVSGMENLLRLYPDLEVTVLDDAMQHRSIQPSLNIMLSDFQRPFYKDLVLPAGLLREPRGGAARADAIIVTKCPAALTENEKREVERKVRRYSRADAPVFFTAFRYGDAVSMGSLKYPTKNIVLLTGIANATPLIQYLNQENYKIRQHLSFADHHEYTRQDLEELMKLIKSEQEGTLSILTTRKDAVKLAGSELLALTRQLPIFFIPIEVYFLERGDEFDGLIRKHLKEFAPL